jgi:hypothetical protein
VQRLQQHFVETYAALATRKLSEWTTTNSWPTSVVSQAGEFLDGIGRDLKAHDSVGDQQEKLEPVRKAVEAGRGSILKSIDGYFARKLAFPVALNTNQTETAEQLGVLRKELEGLLGAVQKPVWRDDKSGALDTLRTNCNAVADVLRSLVKTDGSPVELELVFVPPAGSSDDYVMITIFRGAEASTGKNIPDLTKATDDGVCALGKLPLDAPLSIKLSRSLNDRRDVVEFKEDNWALIRLIYADKAEPLEGGSKWRFRIPLRDGNRTGYAMFEARLDPKKPLPTKQAWPKAK